MTNSLYSAFLTAPFVSPLGQMKYRKDKINNKKDIPEVIRFSKHDDLIKEKKSLERIWNYTNSGKFSKCFI